MTTTLPDKIRGWLSAPYAERAAAARARTEYLNGILDKNTGGSGGRRGGRNSRLDRGSSGQPYGTSGTRTLSGATRRAMVRRSREIYENNVFGTAMLNRATDNIIGEGMTVQSTSKDEGFRRDVEALWKTYSPDARGVMGMSEWQWGSYLAYRRDGDIGGVLLKGGEVQCVETDYIQTPGYGIDRDLKNGQRIIDGVQISASGRPLAYHVVTDGSRPGRTETRQIAKRNFLFIHDNDRLNSEATRGCPALASIGRLLDQMDGTVEAVVVAHRMAAAFGLVRSTKSAGKTFSQIPKSLTNTAGDSQPSLVVEPGSIGFIGEDEDITQIKPEQPTTGFDGFMTYLTRVAGIRFGLPLELAMMDFSKTNYSSARASMEQAYRSFRVQQNRYASRWLAPLYRWRVSKWVNDGTLSGAPDDFFEHRWYGQEWPYLDPQKEAVGALTAVDAGMSTLTKELRKRGMDFEDWVVQRKSEIDTAASKGVPLMHSKGTRDATSAAVTQETKDDDDGNAQA